MTPRMNSRVKVRRTYRLFAWSAVCATILVLGLFGLALIFPPEATPPYALSAGGVSNSPGVSLRDFHLLLLVSSLIVAVVSFAGLAITSVLEWFEDKKEREQAAMRDGGRDGRATLMPEPANERLRALRAVTTSSIEEAPAQKT